MTKESFRFWSALVGDAEELKRLQADGWKITDETLTGYVLSKTEPSEHGG